ncbi:hypothetical protein FHL15_011065 [Xylaria flabelliformis]|uniref:Uncharacterized protein n=1 Tax=Xylaria flabelliformis TaxID=2512241 RepID=A0A553HJG5_9PEZI|nr:hypothetical protein FHL15_011065 [Xylaria flabelliformis]
MKDRIENQSGKKASALKRTMFTLSRNQYADLILIIREVVASLGNLTDHDIELEPALKVRSQRKLFKISRTMSKSLYHALKSSLDCLCSHDISLKLEKRRVHEQSDLPPTCSLPSFRRSDRGTSKKEWGEILVKPKLLPTDDKYILETKSL